MSKVVVLFSGGADSTTCIALAQERGLVPHALSVNYGQKHLIELKAAEKIAKKMRVPHVVVECQALGAIGGSALTDEAIDIPDFDGTGFIPSTYVPARNIILLSVALAYAESIDADAIYFGVNQHDQGFPDCQPAFVEAYQKVIDSGVKKSQLGGRIELVTPLMGMSKASIFLMGHALGIDYADTISCYRPNKNGHACGRCDCCVLRKDSFDEAGLTDETIYSEARAQCLDEIMS